MSEQLPSPVEGAAGRKRQGPLRGFVEIVAGTALGQILTFVAMPFLSRLYEPADFGVLTFSLALIGIVMPIAMLGFDQAVLQPRTDTGVAPGAITGIATLVTTCVILAGVIAWTPMVDSLGPDLRPYLVWALPLLLLVTGTTSLLSSLAIRSGRYGSLGGRNSIQSVAITASQLSLSGVPRGMFSGLVSGALIGTSLGTLLLGRYGARYYRSVTLAECLQSVRRYWKFSVVFAPLLSITLLAQQAPALFTIYWFGVHDGGQVGMAERVVAVPLALLGLAASSVFTGELSHALRSDRQHARSIYVRMSLWLSLPAVAVFAGLLFLAPWAFPLFLGNSWETAARVAQIMAVVALTRMLANPLRTVFRVLERAGMLLLIEGSRMLLLIVAILITMTGHLDLLSGLLLVYGALAIADVATWVLGLAIVSQSDRSALTQSS